MLSDSPDRDFITGYSIVDKAFRTKRSKDTYGFVTVLTLKGKKSIDEHGGIRLDFAIDRKESSLVSRVTVSPDLEKMQGTSTMQGGSGDSLSYNWTAERL